MITTIDKNQLGTWEPDGLCATAFDDELEIKDRLPEEIKVQYDGDVFSFKHCGAAGHNFILGPGAFYEASNPDNKKVPTGMQIFVGSYLGVV